MDTIILLFVIEGKCLSCFNVFRICEKRIKGYFNVCRKVIFVRMLSS